MSPRRDYFDAVAHTRAGPVPEIQAEKSIEGALSGIDIGEKFDYDFLQAQLRLAQAAQLLREKCLGHGLGEQRPASLSSQPSSVVASTPDLIHNVQTPSDGGSIAQKPGAVDIHTQARLQHAVDNDAELDKLVQQLHTQRASRSSSTTRSDSDYFSKVNRSGHGSIREEREEELSENNHSQPDRIDNGSPRMHKNAGTRASRSILPRSRSLSGLSRPTSFVHKRRSSLPTQAREASGHYSYFVRKSPVRELNRPHESLAMPKPASKSDPELSDDTIESVATVSVPRPEETEKGQSFAPERSWWAQIRQAYVATYAPVVPPELIMPTAPTDEEKVSYLKTNRILLYSFGVLSFLSLSAGMWLFVVSAIPFYWFGLMVVLLQAYLFVSYSVSLVGKDFDYESHRRILEEHPILPDTAPTVDIYLPCCKEPIEVLENTYKHVKQLEWPAGKLKVYVLDDGADKHVEALAKSYCYEYIVREDRPRLKKAGNLRWAFSRTSGDFFNIYDADFCPRPDFLKEIIPHHLAHPQTAIVQTPQYFRTLEQQTWVEQGAGSVQELFYRVIQVNRNRWGASICVGSNAVYRREALVDVGGTAEIGYSEDVHTGFYALTRGWEVRYVPLCLACGICPDTPRAFFSQQMRWCMGSTTLLTNPEFWKSNLTVMQKICYLSGMMYYSAISLSIVLNPLPGILMIWIRPDYVRFYNLAFAVPSLIYSLVAIRCWAKARYGLNVQFIMYIQTYAYFTAIKDRLIGRGLSWVPSGDTKAHKNNKYRNMRIMAWTWILSAMGALIAGVTWQCIHGLDWYDAFPILCLTAFNFFLAHRFLFCHGKL